MTLEEAIKHCEEIAKECELRERTTVCAEEHYQLAEWLKELKVIKDAERNDLLSWLELKKMKGKPVWVEIGDGSKGWVIIRKINENGIVTGSDGFVGIADVYGMPTTWQAYRKERKG